MEGRGLQDNDCEENVEVYLKSEIHIEVKDQLKIYAANEKLFQSRDQWMMKKCILIA